MGNGKVSKLSNSYADALDVKVFERMPKTVLAAVAVSLATCGGDRLDEATRLIVREWLLLAENGIVPQAPSRGLVYAYKADEDE